MTSLRDPVTDVRDPRQLQMLRHAEEAPTLGFDDVAHRGRAGRSRGVEGSVSFFLILYSPLNTLCLGPFFVAFPNLKHALENNIAIKTQARACTILPNFIGCVSLYLCLRMPYTLCKCTDPVLLLATGFALWSITARITFR